MRREFLGPLAAPLTLTHHSADRFGRRRLCLIFTITYTLSCLTKLFRPLPSLLLGRLLGGLSTSVLFSAFESWLVTEANEKGMPQGDLQAFLGRLTLVNGLTACVAGVLSEAVVQHFKTFKAPFIASALFLVVGGVVISTTWEENYGEEKKEGGQRRWQHLGEGIKVTWQSSSLLCLLGVITTYESSMYLMVFLCVRST